MRLVCISHSSFGCRWQKPKSRQFKQKEGFVGECITKGFRHGWTQGFRVLFTICLSPPLPSPNLASFPRSLKADGPSLGIRPGKGAVSALPNLMA